MKCCFTFFVPQPKLLKPFVLHLTPSQPFPYIHVFQQPLLWIFVSIGNLFLPPLILSLSVSEAFVENPAEVQHVDLVSQPSGLCGVVLIVHSFHRGSGSNFCLHSSMQKCLCSPKAVAARWTKYKSRRETAIYDFIFIYYYNYFFFCREFVFSDVRGLTTHQ